MEVELVSDACRKAQALVSDVAEPSYRVAAFQVVLDRLLSGKNATAVGSSIASVANEPPEKGNRVRSQSQRRIIEMLSEGYFDEPRLPSEVRDELKARAFHHNANDVGMALLRLAQKKILRRITVDKTQYRYVRA